METVQITQFDGGMVNDPRETRENICQILKHFDAFTNKHKLTPYRTATSGDSLASTHQIANFLYANGILYGLGTIDGTGSAAPAAEPALYKMTDLTSATWVADSHGSAPTGAIPSTGNRSDAETAAFCWYQTTGKIYGVRDLRYVWSVTPGSTFSSTALDTGAAFTYCSNMLVHSKDDILYFGYDNKIAKNSNDSWTAAALTLPNKYVITSLAEFGNYLAIAVRPKDRTRSKLFLWNRDSTVTTLDESIDWGEGELYMLEELEGYLIGVSFVFATPGATSLDDQFMIQTRVIFKYYTGSGQAIKFQEFVGASTSPAVSAGFTLCKQKANNRIYFVAGIPIVTTGYQGVWSIGRNSSGVPFGVTLDRLIDSGTTVNSLYASFLVGDYMFSAYSISSVYSMDKTNSTASYTATSIYESTINPQMPTAHRPLLKKMMCVAISITPLTSGQQLVLKYRVEGGSWVTLLTVTTVGTTVAEFTKASTSITSGREYEFRIESTGGAEPTGLYYKYDIVKTHLS